MCLCLGHAVLFSQVNRRAYARYGTEKVLFCFRSVATKTLKSNSVHTKPLALSLTLDRDSAQAFSLIDRLWRSLDCCCLWIVQSQWAARAAHNEVRWRPGQETSLAPPCSNLRSFESKSTVLKKVLVTLLGLFSAPCSHSVPPAVIRRPCSPIVWQSGLRRRRSLPVLKMESACSLNSITFLRGKQLAVWHDTKLILMVQHQLQVVPWE